MIETPVAFFIFNRPDTTKRVFAEIARAKPKKLLVIADGPRPDAEEDIEKCTATRAVIDHINWDCELLKYYSDINLGCKRRISSGLNWVFEHCEEAIILEDDCLPHPTFFQYCAELLERYRDDERIMVISGNNFLFEERQVLYSYYYSCYAHIWGWASWRRAWKYYDVEMQLWPVLKETSWLSAVLGDPISVKHWEGIFNETYSNSINTWDYQLQFTCWAQNGLTVIPNTNLVTNIGFGKDATRTLDCSSKISNMQLGEMLFPLYAPPYIVRDFDSDQLVFQLYAQQGNEKASTIFKRIGRILYRLMFKPVQNAVYRYFAKH